MKGYVLVAALATLSYPASAETVGEILVAQMKLRTLGYEVGKPDGRMGPATRKGLNAAAVKNGFDPTLAEMFKFFAIKTVTGETKVEDEGILKVVKDAVGDSLKDPFSAEYKDIRRLPSGRICGEVNAKNLYGAYVGWQTFMTYGPLIKLGETYMKPSVMVDDGEDELAYMACLIDA
ncbi:peptidoglycan-binding domain-containing protein [Paracoccus aminovorans]|uniref:peptidoglycan-binding domain-containing protein n=1 Tax=Paracoccus aminovorans TaxID=34004 RepID=UPI000780F0FE|nr:hypothetical protein [Paracoccus aminovorans]